MIAFIDDHRDVYGVEPICKVLPIAELCRPRMRSPSQCPGIARSSTSGGRSLIMTAFPTKDFPRPRVSNGAQYCPPIGVQY